MPSLVCIALVCSSVSLGMSAIAKAEQHEPARLHPPKSTTTIELFNPVAFLSQVITSVIGVDSATFERVSFGPSISRTPLVSTANALSVQFIPGGDQQKVALVLAESQLRVKLTQDWLLRCELASRDEANADAELQVDLGLQFKFK